LIEYYSQLSSLGPANSESLAENRIPVESEPYSRCGKQIPNSHNWKPARRGNLLAQQFSRIQRSSIFRCKESKSSTLDHRGQPVAVTHRKSASAADQIMRDKDGNDVSEKSSDGMPASLHETRPRIEGTPQDIAQPKTLPVQNLGIPLSDEGKDRTPGDSSKTKTPAGQSACISDDQQTIKGTPWNIVVKRGISVQSKLVSKSDKTKQGKEGETLIQKSTAQQRRGITGGHQRQQAIPRDIVGQKHYPRPSPIVSKRHESTQGRCEDVGPEKGTPSQMTSVSDKWKGVPSFSYIGVSKLSCAAWQMWIDGYNSQNGLKFYTKGSHGKWYWPWGLPRLDESRLKAYMVDQISTTYYEHCRAKRRLRMVSDGSTAAGNSVPVVVDQKCWALATAHIPNPRIGEGSSG